MILQTKNEDEVSTTNKESLVTLKTEDQSVDAGKGKFFQSTKLNRLLLIGIAAFVIAGLSCLVFMLCCPISDLEPNQSTQDNVQTQQNSIGRQDLFENISTTDEALTSTATDRAGTVSFKYPSMWGLTSADPGIIFNRQISDFFFLTSPSAPSVTSMTDLKNAVQAYVIPDIGDMDEFLINVLGYESPGVKYKPEKLVINKYEGYYQKIQKAEYTDHAVLIMEGKKSLLFTFREKQNFSDETAVTGVVNFDESTDLPVFKSIVLTTSFL